MSTLISAVRDRYLLPSWRGGQLVEPTADQPLESYTLIGVRLASAPSEDSADYLEAILGYCWTKHMGGAPSTRAGLMSIHDDLVVFDAPVGLRSVVTRTRTQATRDLIADLRLFYAEGSPVRKTDGLRRLKRPAGVELPDLLGVLFG
ncbi:hypothetical protein [Nocardia sp. NPDC052566]|uniref:hypothetical protein n=1 Tax=Nocardia sp. NPDC052566 TaxID=3364330 RepID=UPI0037C7C5AC